MSIQSDALTDDQQRKARLAEQAIDNSERGEWEEAAATNQAVLEIDPTDVAAAHRLGRACVELGRLGDALQAYERALTIEPSSVIAKRNSTRLRDVIEHLGSDTVTVEHPEPLHSEQFIMQIGRSGIVAVEDIRAPERLGTLLPGDFLRLSPDGPYLRLHTSSGEYVGLVPAERSGRVIELISMGNTYSAVVVSASVERVDVLISETYRSPETHGKLPFPAIPRPTPESRAAVREAAAVVPEEEYVEEPEIDEEAEETEVTPTATLAEPEDTDEAEEE